MNPIIAETTTETDITTTTTTTATQWTCFELGSFWFTLLCSALLCSALLRSFAVLMHNFMVLDIKYWHGIHSLSLYNSCTSNGRTKKTELILLIGIVLVRLESSCHALNSLFTVLSVLFSTANAMYTKTIAFHEISYLDSNERERARYCAQHKPRPHRTVCVCIVVCVSLNCMTAIHLVRLLIWIGFCTIFRMHR